MKFAFVLLAALQTAAPVDVLTQHNDTERTGWNRSETILSPATVSPGTFGKLFDLPVDGLAYAQPLIVSGIAIAGKTRNLLIAATEHNSLYGFDADTGERLWQRNFGTPAPSPNASFNLPWNFYRDMTPEMGITGTPVVDRATNTIYLSHVTWDPFAKVPKTRFWMRAIDLTTSRDKFGSPVAVQGEVALRGQRTAVGRPRHDLPVTMQFDPGQHLQRPGLLLSQGRVMVAFAGRGDKAPFQGWVFAYDGADLKKPPMIWNAAAGGPLSTALTAGAGIWQGGMGLTADGGGNVYLITGNGDFSESLERYGDSVVKLSGAGGTLQAVSYFAPCNQAILTENDWDLGASGVLHLPGTNLILGGGKQGRLYLMNTDNLGKSVKGDTFNCVNPNVVQEFQTGCLVKPRATTSRPTPCTPVDGDHASGDDEIHHHHIHGSPVFWRSGRLGPVVYVWPENDVLHGIPFDEKQGKFVNANRLPISAQGCENPVVNPVPEWAAGKAKSPGSWVAGEFTQLHEGMTGGMLSISSNGGEGGIVWATTPTNNDANQKVVPGILRAYDANDLRQELWNSKMAEERDDLGNYSKHSPPTVANGKVYVPTFSRRIAVYGLNPPAPPVEPNLLANGDFEQGTQGWTGVFQVNDAYPYDGKQQAAQCPDDTNGAMLSQTVTAPRTAAYKVTAYAATNILGLNVIRPSLFNLVTVGVSVDGRPIPTRPLSVTPFAGYQPYTFTFKAERGSKIRVFYISPKVKAIPDFGTPEDKQPPRYSILDRVSLRAVAQSRLTK